VSSWPPRAQHAWWIVAVAVMAHFATAGVSTYAFGIFLKPVAQEFGAGRWEASLGYTLMAYAGAVFAPFVGRALERVPVRRLMIAGALVVAGSLALIAAARELWQIGALLVLGLAPGLALCGSLAAMALIVNWFARLRGRALGIATTGTSLGGALAPPLVAALLLHFGWRGSLLWLALAFVVLLVPLVALAVRTRPEDVGLGMDGAPAPQPAAGGPAAIVEEPADAWTIARTLRAPHFWLIAVFMGVIYSNNTALVIHLPAHASDAGIDAQRAAYLPAALGLSAFLGKVAYSLVGDRVPDRPWLWLAAIFQVLGWVALLGSPHFSWLLAIAIGSGLTTGAVLPAWNALVSRCFGRAAFARVMGLIRPVFVVVMNVGVPVAGWIFDRWGSYAPAFQLFAVLTAAVALLPLWRRVPGAQPSAAVRAAVAGPR
jgi:MFS family permease